MRKRATSLMLAAFAMALVFGPGTGVAEPPDGNGLQQRVAALEARLAAALARIELLETGLAREATVRHAADATLQQNTGAEAAARAASDAALQADIDAETATRAAADTALQGNIDAETAARIAADALLQGNVDAEMQARVAADSALQDQITNAGTVPQNLLDLADYVSVDLTTINGLQGPHVMFTGANVHIRNGHMDMDTDTVNGLGNLLVGYNEADALDRSSVRVQTVSS
jgi:hypothetical protein